MQIDQQFCKPAGFDRTVLGVFNYVIAGSQVGMEGETGRPY